MTDIDAEFEKETTGPHDAAFKSAFQRKEVAKSFFRRYFPKKIVDQIDFRTLAFNNRSYVDEKLREKHSDIVYRTKIKGEPAFLYILFEHQSSPDFWIVFRLLCYMVNLWREYLDQHPDAKKLPVIIPAVLYHGKKAWNTPGAFAAIVNGGEDMARHIPDFSYDLYNLADHPDEQLLLEDGMALGVVLYLMKHIFDKDYPDKLLQAMEYLSTIDDQTVQLEFLEWALRYSYHARDDAKDSIDRAVDVIDNANARRNAMTIAERLKQEGRQEGRREGRQEGRAAIIQRQINKRFGPMSPFLESSLQNSEADLLDRFGESLFDFKNLKDAENWWKTHGKEGNA